MADAFPPPKNYEEVMQRYYTSDDWLVQIFRIHWYFALVRKIGEDNLDYQTRILRSVAIMFNNVVVFYSESRYLRNTEVRYLCNMQLHSSLEQQNHAKGP
jgi:hypothetical protein